MLAQSLSGPALILTNGMLDSTNAKTAHGLLRGSDRFTPLAVIDHRFAGQDGGEVMDGRRRGVPIVASVADYFADPARPRPQFCIVGVALPGGKLPADFRAELEAAMQHGLSVINGLHTFLSDDAAFMALAAERGVTVFDVRKPRPRTELHFWSGEIYRVRAPRIAVLGTDCALGKRTTCRFLMEACRGAGLRAEMIYTGQTGWMQGSPYGFIFDSTVNDFIGGEIERAIVECDRAAHPDLILIEGQSSLRNPSGPCGSEFLLSGHARGVVLQHAPGRHCYEGSDVPIGSLASEIGLIQMYGARVLAVTLNEEEMTDTQMRAVQAELETDLQLPVVRPLHEGVDRLVPVIQDFLHAQRSGE